MESIPMAANGLAFEALVTGPTHSCTPTVVICHNLVRLHVWGRHSLATEVTF